MARFLLIHGACHGAWCWRDVVPALEALGHEVTAMDLPSHGNDPTPAETVTLSDYGSAITEALVAPTILVGHSMGGYAITQAAEQAPDQIARLVYLCAYTPWPGLTLSQMRQLADDQPLLPFIRMAADRKSFTFDPEAVPKLFYHDCTDEAVAFAMPRLTPQAAIVSNTVVTLTSRSQSLPRSYIQCRQDGAIPPALQAEMAARFAPEDVFALDSSHSPFFSMPGALADTLHAIAVNHSER